MNSSPYEFTTPWFDNVARDLWTQLIPKIRPQRVLEIGSYEGASTCFLIDTLAPLQPLEIHCVDTWQGGLEHQTQGSAPADMAAVERRFLSNTELACQRAPQPVTLTQHKGPSDQVLANLLAQGRHNYFDFIYVDGSHQAPDVLADAVLSFRLLRPEGIMAFDDYLWSEPLPSGVDPIRSPKIAIDAFTTIYTRKLRILSLPLYQLYVQKIGD